MEPLDLSKKCSSTKNSELEVEALTLTKNSNEKECDDSNLQMPKLVKIEDEIAELKKNKISTPMREEIQIMEEKILEEFKAMQQMADKLKKLTTNIIEKDDEIKKTQEIVKSEENDPKSKNSTLGGKHSLSSTDNYPTLKKRLLSDIQQKESQLDEKTEANDETGENDGIKAQTEVQKTPRNEMKFEPIKQIIPENELKNFIQDNTPKYTTKSKKSSDHNNINYARCERISFRAKKCTKKMSKRQAGFGYVAVDRNKKGQIYKFSLGTFTELVTVKNCEGKFFEKLEKYMIKLNLNYVYMIKDKNSKLEKSKRCIKPFMLKNISDTCKKCKQNNCTAGKVTFYFVYFHRVNFFNCENA